ncbi:MAG: AmmeMemoRadiSam system protein B [Rhodospirillaceae bacterium]|nr:AmmeMemoRadiSam system protein B [Rhodospirillaceae bacterium]MDD9917613.1 AmmeMemoRadiSam system protein B [Rhodospirillaceae bacterium]
MGHIRAAAVSGMFYPDDPRELAASVARYMASAVPAGGAVPKAIVAPHAGYIYSGAIAGRAYATVKAAADRITRVVLLGPAHRVAFDGLAAPEADAFQTPLGQVKIDLAAIHAVADLPQLVQRDDAHREEHSLEVHLPFLQEMLGDFALVPLVVGRASEAEVAQVLDRLWGGDETLIVISTDLSHYEDYATAQRMDSATAAAIEELRTDGIRQPQACGRIPVCGLMTTAKKRGMTVERLDLKNSGDTAGSKDRVVGYGAWAFHDAVAPNDTEIITRHRAEILRVAGASIKHGLAKGKPPAVDVKSFTRDLQPQRATFVTLKKDGKLRGCIGTVTAHRPFVEDIVHNAYAAAFRDHRFAPLQADEASSTRVSVSLLGIPQAMRFADEADFRGQLRPHRDGLIIRDGDKRAVFLPQVWDELPDPATFLSHLKRKAGLAEDHWSDRFEAWRFSSSSTDKITPEVK